MFRAVFELNPPAVTENPHQVELKDASFTSKFLGFLNSQLFHISPD